MAEFWGFSSLARPLQSFLRPRDGPAGQRKTPRRLANVCPRCLEPPVRRRLFGRHLGRFPGHRDRPRQPEPDGLTLTDPDHSDAKDPFSMFGPETTARFASATFAVILTVASFAYAILPASPGMAA
ncbi:MAG: hypothetical protein OHK0018_00540 [Erythrobacter tepidarius]